MVKKSKDGWVMTKAYHPTAFEKGIYVIDFWKEGTIKIDKNIKRFQIEAKSRSEAIKKAWKKI